MDNFLGSDSFRSLIETPFSMVILWFFLAPILYRCIDNKKTSVVIIVLTIPIFFMMHNYFDRLRVNHDLPDLSPAELSITTELIESLPNGGATQINIQNIGYSDKPVTVTSVKMNIRKSSDYDSSDASGYFGHGASTIDEILVVHNADGSRNFFFVNAKGDCSEKKTGSENILHSLERAVIVSLKKDEVFSIVVRNIFQSAGVYDISWEIKYNDFNGKVREIKSDRFSMNSGGYHEKFAC